MQIGTKLVMKQGCLSAKGVPSALDLDLQVNEIDIQT